MPNCGPCFTVSNQMRLEYNNVRKVQSPSSAAGASAAFAHDEAETEAVLFDAVHHKRTSKGSTTTNVFVAISSHTISLPNPPAPTHPIRSNHLHSTETSSTMSTVLPNLHSFLLRFQSQCLPHVPIFTWCPPCLF